MIQEEKVRAYVTSTLKITELVSLRNAEKKEEIKILSLNSANFVMQEKNFLTEIQNMINHCDKFSTIPHGIVPFIHGMVDWIFRTSKFCQWIPSSMLHFLFKQEWFLKRFSDFQTLNPIKNSQSHVACAVVDNKIQVQLLSFQSIHSGGIVKHEHLIASFSLLKDIPTEVPTGAKDEAKTVKKYTKIESNTLW